MPHRPLLWRIGAPKHPETRWEGVQDDARIAAPGLDAPALVGNCQSRQDDRADTPRELVRHAIKGFPDLALAYRMEVVSGRVVLDDDVTVLDLLLGET